MQVASIFEASQFITVMKISIIQSEGLSDWSEHSNQSNLYRMFCMYMAHIVKTSLLKMHIMSINLSGLPLNGQEIWIPDIIEWSLLQMGTAKEQMREWEASFKLGEGKRQKLPTLTCAFEARSRVILQA